MRRFAGFLLVCLIMSMVSMAVTFGPTGAAAVLTVTPSPTPPTRDVEIAVLTETAPGDWFEIGEVFALRDREGFLLWTHQSHFWEPGDDFGVGNPSFKIILDDTVIENPFVFWHATFFRDVYDDDGVVIGTYLDSYLNISVSTLDLDLGTHTMTAIAETDDGRLFSQSWDFVIRARETPRVEAPPGIAPTAQYLYDSPLPTPVFITRLLTEAAHWDRWICYDLREGILVSLDDTIFVPPELADNAFRHSMWDDITLSIDDVVLSDEHIRWWGTDHPRLVDLCMDTDYLAAGIHLAEITLTVEDATYTHTWGFLVE